MSRKRVLVSRFDDSGSEQALIPGLPDDVATLCLLRVPVEAHAPCKGVSRGWHSIFRRFSALRKACGLEDRWLLITGFDQDTDLTHFVAFNLTTLSWRRIHIPNNLYQARWCTVSVSIPREGVLFVLGGVACRGSAVNVFLKYEAREDRWTVIKSMAGELFMLRAGVIDGKVYVTGLDKELSDCEHDPVEVLDPKEGTWKPVPDFERTGFDPCRVTVFDEKLLLTYLDDSMPGQSYDPRTGRWEDMAAGLSWGLRSGSSVQVREHLFALTRFTSSGLMVYDAKSESWDAVEGDCVPRGVWWTSPVSCWDDKIYVAKDDYGLIGVVVGNISKRRIVSSDCDDDDDDDDDTRWYRFRVQWEMVVDAPRDFRILTPVGAEVLFA